MGEFALAGKHKAEVKNWPVFGWCAQRGGTLFIDLTRRTDVSRISREIQEVLNTGQVVVLFPEGTSSNGHEVLPLKSSLLEPVCASNHPLSVAHISYELDQGSVENDVCYWGGMTFLPHVVRLMDPEKHPRPNPLCTSRQPRI